MGDDVGLPSSASSEAASGTREVREVMNAEEAAEYLRIPYDSFRRIAPELPRHQVTKRRYVYFRSELSEWLLHR